MPMPMPRALLRALLLLAGGAAVLGLFEEQLGEADWAIENIGTLRHVIYQVRGGEGRRRRRSVRLLACMHGTCYMI
jgi:hypothetical protein